MHAHAILTIVNSYANLIDHRVCVTINRPKQTAIKPASERPSKTADTLKKTDNVKSKNFKPQLAPKSTPPRHPGTSPRYV